MPAVWGGEPLPCQVLLELCRPARPGPRAPRAVSALGGGWPLARNSPGARWSAGSFCWSEYIACAS